MTTEAQNTPAAQPAPTPEAATATPAVTPATPNVATPDTEAAAPASTTEQPATPETATPIEYKFNLPEGVALDEELSKKFIEFAQSKNLSNEEAQGLIDLRLAEVKKQQEAHIATVNQWEEQARADKEYGGSSFVQNLAVANKAVKAFCTPELIGLLKDTGFSNHPEIIRAFVKIGKAVGEDKLINRDAVSPIPTSSTVGARLYPQSNMNKE